MELKTIDTGLQLPGVINAGGFLGLLNGISQGTDYTERIGRQVNLESIHLRVFGLINPIANPTGDYLRTMIIVDSQPNGAAPTVADILEGSNITSQLNLNNRDRFTTLYNNIQPIEAFTFTAGALTGGSPCPTLEQVYQDIDIDTTFSSNGSTIASINTNSVYILLITLNSSLNVSYNSRIRFTDC